MTRHLLHRNVSEDCWLTHYGEYLNVALGLQQLTLSKWGWGLVECVVVLNAISINNKHNVVYEFYNHNLCFE